MSIKRIDKESVTRLCSGQVVPDLSAMVKEVVENGVDAKASQIEVRFTEYGEKLIEVIDNGTGIKQEDFPFLAQRYYTSKLTAFEDLERVKTLGFRGEALSSISNVARLVVTTATATTAPQGFKLTFDSNGQLERTSVTARQQGTTCQISDLFHEIPVRREDFRLNAKRHYTKCLQVLYGYALVCTSVRFKVTNKDKKGKLNVVFATNSSRSIKDNYSTLFGNTNLSDLVPFSFTFGGSTEESGSQPQVPSRIHGYVSKTPSSNARATDKQFLYINQRPCTIPKIIKVFNEIFRSKAFQNPILIGLLEIPLDSYDVNVSPDKRTILLHKEKEIITAIKGQLSEFLDSSKANIPLNSNCSRSLIDHFTPTKDKDIHLTSKSSSDLPLTSPVSTKRKIDYLNSNFSSDNNDRLPKIPCPQEFLDEQERENSLIFPTSTTNFLPKKTLPVSALSSKYSAPPNHPSGNENSEILSDDPPVNNHIRLLPNRPFNNNKSSVPSTTTFVNNYPKSLPDDLPMGSNNLKEPLNKPLINKGSKIISYPPTVSLSLNVPSKKSPPIAANASSVSMPSVPAKTHDSLPHASDTERIIALNRSTRESTESSHSRPPTETIETEPPRSDTVPTLEPELCIDHSTKPDTALIPRTETCTDHSVKPDTGVVAYDPESYVLEDEEPEEYLISTNPAIASGLVLNWEWILDVVDVPATKQATDLSLSDAHFTNKDQDAAAQALTFTINPSVDFMRMAVVGQFNLGFIVAQMDAQLFIIDQHAADEIYHYTKLHSALDLPSQPLAVPRPLHLAVTDEIVAMENLDFLKTQGYHLLVNDDRPLGQKLSLASVPHTATLTFNPHDLDQILHSLGPDSACLISRTLASRGGKLDAKLASQACRRSIMIGDHLDVRTMTQVLHHLALLPRPWNCPHGRPTLRHLTSL